MPQNPSTIVSARYRRGPLDKGSKIAAWLAQFDRELIKEGRSRHDVCAIVADVVKGKKSELRWVGEAKFADMLLWLACRCDVGVIGRVSNGATSLDFEVDVYPWGEVDVWLSGGPSLHEHRPRHPAPHIDEAAIESETDPAASSAEVIDVLVGVEKIV